MEVIVGNRELNSLRWAAVLNSSIGVTWLITWIGGGEGQNLSCLVGTLIYRGVNLDTENLFKRRFFVFILSLHNPNNRCNKKKTILRQEKIGNGRLSPSPPPSYAYEYKYREPWNCQNLKHNA